MAQPITVVETFPVGTAVTAYLTTSYLASEYPYVKAPAAGGGTSLGTVASDGTVDVASLGSGTWILVGTVSAVVKVRRYANKTGSSPYVPAGGTTGQSLQRDSSGNAVWADSGASAGSVAPYMPSAVTVSAATTTLDAASHYDSFFRVVLSATATTLALANVPAGGGGQIRIVQDATGGRTCTIPSGWKKAGGVGITVSGGSSAVDELGFFSPDGTVIEVFVIGQGMA